MGKWCFQGFQWWRQRWWWWWSRYWRYWVLGATIHNLPNCETSDGLWIKGIRAGITRRILVSQLKMWMISARQTWEWCGYHDLGLLWASVQNGLYWYSESALQTGPKQSMIIWGAPHKLQCLAGGPLCLLDFVLRHLGLDTHAKVTTPFLATLVALHFTPVSESVGES